MRVAFWMSASAAPHTASASLMGQTSSSRPVIHSREPRGRISPWAMRTNYFDLKNSGDA